jgi:2-methylcitrate dehydratase PrpD
MSSTAINQFAGFISGHSSERYSAVALERAKYAFLDTIGCMLPGAQSDAAQIALATVADWGKGPAPVYGTRATLPAPWAAMVNATAAHAFDLDDFTLQANDHASAVLVPAILATAASSQTPVTGRALLDAYITGLEVIYRLGEAVNMSHYKLGWHTTSTLDSIGATAAACRLQRLNARQSAAALSLTTSMGSGYVSQFGTTAKPLHAGFSAKAAVLASRLGASGASAYGGALDGKVSFSTLLVLSGAARFEEALAKLGKPLGIEEFGLVNKLYPSCGYTHRAVDAARELRTSLGIASADEVESVDVSLPDFYLDILPFQVPATVNEALFSTAWCVATALATGHNTIADFSTEALQRADILALTSRVQVTGRAPVRPQLNLDPRDPDTVRVRLRDGRVATAAVGEQAGAPGRAFGPDDFSRKFRQCCLASGPDEKQANARADRVMDAVGRMDTDTGLSELNAAISL